MRKLAFLFLFSFTLQAQENPREAIEQLSRSAKQALDKQQFEKAESDLRRMAAISLDQAGVISNALNDSMQAEAAYRGVIRLSPSASRRASLGLGVVYLKTGRYAEGIEAVEKTLPIDMLDPDARHLLGKLYFMKRDFSRAALELGQAYNAQPDNGRIGYTLGLAYLRQRKLPEAKQVFADITKKLGDTPQLHILLGRAFRETGYTQDAIAEFRRALELDPKYPRAHYYLGVAELAAAGGGALPEARREFEAELAEHPNVAGAHLMLGVVLLNFREYPAATSHLRRAVELDKNNPDGYLYLGQSLFQSGDSAGAIPMLKRCIQVTPYPERADYLVGNAHFLLGQALRKVGQMSEAQEHFKRSQELKTLRARSVETQPATETKPAESMGSGMGDVAIAQLARTDESAVILDADVPDAEERKILEGGAAFYRSAAGSAYYGLARLEIYRSNLERAAEYMESAALWDDSLPDLYYNLGVTQAKTQQPAKAATSLLKALEANPGKQETLALLGSLTPTLVDKGMAAEALPVTEALLKRNPELADLYLLRGRAFARIGKWDEALPQFRTALAKNPNLPDAHYYAGTVLIRQGELDKAREEFDKELALNPGHSRALYHKAFVLVSQRKMDEAVPLLEAVIRMEPNYAEPYYQLGRAQSEGTELLVGIANLEAAAHLNPNAPYIFYQLSRAYSKAQRKEDATRALDRYRELKKAERDARSVPPALESQ